MTTCERCGESNPAEIHTCTPKSEECCAECGKKSSDGWALYCVKCSEREWQGLTDEEMQHIYTNAAGVRHAMCLVEAKLKEKNA
jgi:hypothetical protein